MTDRSRFQLLMFSSELQNVLVKKPFHSHFSIRDAFGLVDPNILQKA